jgi:hypothetical protein
VSDERKCGNPECGATLVVGENWWPSYAKRNNRTCRGCAAANTAAWRAANPEKSKASYTTWRAANPERVREGAAARRAANKERQAATNMLNRARRRAAERGLPFDLDGRLDDLHEIIADGACHYSGLPFNVQGGRTWDSPSLDRVDPDLGYVWSNVRVVLDCVNAFKGTTTLEKMCWIAQNLIDWQTAKNSQQEKTDEAAD